jgi:SPP1 family phage portal protein
MEYLCAGVEAYFGRGLQNRIKIISSSSLVPDGDTGDVTISYKRNLPHNLAETAQTAAMLRGTLSQRTILAMFPTTIVPDIDAEIEALEGEAPEVVFSGDNEGL